MNKILFILSFLLIACSNNKTKDNASHKDQHEESEVTSTSLKLNNGAKWKSDDATRKNVTAISKIINDSSSRDVNNQTQLVKLIQARIDTLVMQCKMKGPEHDALHVWLNQVLHNLKELKENSDGEYEKSYAALKKDVDGFYDFFE